MPPQFPPLLVPQQHQKQQMIFQWVKFVKSDGRNAYVRFDKIIGVDFGRDEILIAIENQHPLMVKELPDAFQTMKRTDIEEKPLSPSEN